MLSIERVLLHEALLPGAEEMSGYEEGTVVRLWADDGHALRVSDLHGRVSYWYHAKDFRDVLSDAEAWWLRFATNRSLHMEADLWLRLNEGASPQT